MKELDIAEYLRSEIEVGDYVCIRKGGEGYPRRGIVRNIGIAGDRYKCALVDWFDPNTSSWIRIDYLEKEMA